MHLGTDVDGKIGSVGGGICPRFDKVAPRDVSGIWYCYLHLVVSSPKIISLVW
jgi:hypothetical protein